MHIHAVCPVVQKFEAKIVRRVEKTRELTNQDARPRRRRRASVGALEAMLFVPQRMPLQSVPRGCPRRR